MKPKMKKLYPTDLDPRKLEPHFSQHVAAMTEEGLNDKSAIAEQLAWRDQQIEKLKAALHAPDRCDCGGLWVGGVCVSCNKCFSCGKSVNAEDDLAEALKARQ